MLPKYVVGLRWTGRNAAGLLSVVTKGPLEDLGINIARADCGALPPVGTRVETAHIGISFIPAVQGWFITNSIPYTD